MGAVYATVSDIQAIGKSLTAQQMESAEVLLTQASAKLRTIAKKYSKSIDSMIEEDEDFGLTVKAVVIQAVCRALDAVSQSSTVSQGTETIGAYSLTTTYLNGGQSLYFLKNELKDLGLIRQRYGAIEIYDVGGDD